MVFLSRKLIDGVEHDVRMDVVPVRVDANDRLIPQQMCPHEFLSDFQCQLRADLAGAKGLDDVIELHPVRLVLPLLDGRHIMACRCRQAALGGSEDLFLCLIAVENIVDGLPQSAPAGKDLCDRHQGSATFAILCSTARIRNFSSRMSSFVAKPALTFLAI